jgi:hypothetical protein
MKAIALNLPIAFCFQFRSEGNSWDKKMFLADYQT